MDGRCVYRHLSDYGVAALYLILGRATGAGRLRSQLFRHLQYLPLRYHDNNIIGVTVSRVMNDVGVIDELLSQGLLTMLGDLILLGGIIIVMLTMSPKLACHLYRLAADDLLATHLFAQRAKVAFRQTRSQRGGGGR